MCILSQLWHVDKTYIKINYGFASGINIMQFHGLMFEKMVGQQTLVLTLEYHCSKFK